jgi:hypothetical protein
MRIPRILFALVLAGLLVATTAGTAAAGTARQSGSGSKHAVQVTKFTVTLTSQQTVLEQVGSGGDITYGWNRLTGTAPSASGDIGVTLLGNVVYTNGEGPFFGFLTLKFASLSTVGLRVEGRATKGSDGVTDFDAKMKVIGGNAALTGAKGTGSFTGSRRDDLGGAVELQVTIKLRGIDIG